MSAHLQPTINCPQCDATVFPYIRNGIYRAECVECDWRTIHTIDMKRSELQTHPKSSYPLVPISAATRFKDLCAAIERQGKSGQLLEILEQSFAEVLSELEKPQTSKERLLMSGCGTLAALAVLKHI